jgi:chemotaxis protein histidine kinase CheA
MAGKAASQVRHHTLMEFTEKIQHLHGLVERYAMARQNPDEYLPPIARVFARLKTAFLGAGFDNLSQLCGSMEITSRRGHSKQMKMRILREAVGSMRMQLDVELRSLLAEMKADEEKDKEAGPPTQTQT